MKLVSTHASYHSLIVVNQKDKWIWHSGYNVNQIVIHRVCLIVDWEKNFMGCESYFCSLLSKFCHREIVLPKDYKEWQGKNLFEYVKFFARPITHLTELCASGSVWGHNSMDAFHTSSRICIAYSCPIVIYLCPGDRRIFFYFALGSNVCPSKFCLEDSQYECTDAAISSWSLWLSSDTCTISCYPSILLCPIGSCLHSDPNRLSPHTVSALELAARPGVWDL